MDYTSLEERGGDLVLREIKNFALAQVLDCGQCFRWQGEKDKFKGIAHKRQLELSLENEDLIFKNVSREEFENIWCDYFDLRRDYGELKRHYSFDETLARATSYSPGLRLMKQDAWETLITFILSQNSNIPRIKGMVARLCEHFGQALHEGNNEPAFTFPSPEDLAKLSASDLAPVKTGYRADYIIDAAKRAADGRLDLKKLQDYPTGEIRTALMEVHGVGPKVADCVLLYGFGRVENFPLDVWMKRVMAKYYPQGFPKELEQTVGIAQQFLFHYIRTSDAD